MRIDEMWRPIYDRAATDEAWLDAVVREVPRALGARMGACARLSSAGSVEWQSFGVPFDCHDFHRFLVECRVIEQLESRARPFVSTGTLDPWGHSEVSSPLWQFLHERDVGDMLVLSAAAAGVEVTLLMPYARTLSPSEDDYLAWYRAAVLLNAAARLRGTPKGPSPNEGGDVWNRLLDGRLRLVESFHASGRCVLVLQETTQLDSTLRALSTRERQVVTLAARGLANKHIAFELSLSASTVATYLRKGLDKLGIKSRVELVHHASRFMSEADAPSLGEEVSDVNFDELESALQVCQRELRRLSRMTPIHGAADEPRRKRIAELQRTLRALERVLEPITGEFDLSDFE